MSLAGLTHGPRLPINAGTFPGGSRRGPGLDDRSETDAARDAERLAALEARLAEKRAAPEGQTLGADKFHQANQAWRMVTELVAGLVLGFGIGYGLDRLFGTTPILLVVFTLLGFAAGIKTMLRTAGEMKNLPGHAPGTDEGNEDNGR